MGLFNDYGRFGGSGSTSFATGPAAAAPPPPSAGGGGSGFTPDTTPKAPQRGFPERINLDVMMGGQQGSGTASELLARAPGYFGGALPSVFTTASRHVEQATGFNPLGWLGDQVRKDPSLGPMLQAVGVLSDAAAVPGQLVRKGIQATNASGIRDAMSGDPNAPHGHAGIGKRKEETNGEFLARMRQLGYTDAEFDQIKNGRDIFSFGDDHKLNENEWVNLGLSVLTDPVTYLPFGVASKALRVGTAELKAAQLSEDMLLNPSLGGTALGLKARQGVGMLKDLTNAGVRPVKYVSSQIGAQKIASGAADAAQQATRGSVSDYILSASRGGNFLRGFGKGLNAALPVGKMARTAFDVPGYFTGGLRGYATHSLALRGTEAVADVVATDLDNVFGNHGDSNTPLGGFTENLRNLAHEMLTDDPISTSTTGLLVSGFLFAGIPAIRAAAREYRAPFTEALSRPATLTDIPHASQMLDLFAPHINHRAGKAEHDAAVAHVVNGLGGHESVWKLYNSALTNIVQRRLIEGTQQEWRIRGVVSTSARAAEAAKVYQRSAEYLLANNKVSGEDIVHEIMAMDAQVGGYREMKEGLKANSPLAGGEMAFNPDEAMRSWVRFRAVFEPVESVLHELGLQVTPYVRQNMTSDTIALIRSELNQMKVGKGAKAVIDVQHIQRVMRDHPQLLAMDRYGFFTEPGVLDSGTIKWSRVERKLKGLEKNAATYDELFAEVNNHEASGMGEAVRESGDLSLQNGKIRMAHPLPGEATIAVSRMEPGIAATPASFKETAALRDNPVISAAERNLGAVMHDAGFNVEQVHQTIGGWADQGRVFREPSMVVQMTEHADLAETRLAAASAARSMNQQQTMFWVTGNRLAQMGVEANGSMGRIVNISRRSLPRVEKLVHQRYGDGYTVDDQAGEIIVAGMGSTPEQLLPDLEETVQIARAGKAGVEPAYIEFMGEEIDQTLQENANDIRAKTFADTFNEVVNDPNFDEARLHARISGSRSATYLTPVERRGGVNLGVKSRVATQEGLLREGLKRLELDDGTVAPGLAKEHEALRAKLDNLMAARDAMTTRKAVLYKAEPIFDPLSPLSVPKDAPVVDFEDTIASMWNSKTRHYDLNPPAFDVGTVRVDNSGRVEVLREVRTEDLSWGQKSVTKRGVDEYASDDPPSTEYPRATLTSGNLAGNLMLTEGHHRWQAAIRKGEATIKVWVKEERQSVERAKSNNYYLTHAEVIDRDVSGYQRPTERLNTRTSKPEPLAALPEELVPFEVKTKLADEQVLFNRNRDVAVDDLFPALKWDKTLDRTLTDAEKASLEPAYRYLMDNFGGAYDLKIAPAMAFPIDSVPPASLKVATLLGEWLHQYGPMSGVMNMIHNAVGPVETMRQARHARLAMYRMAIPKGGTVQEVDKFYQLLHARISDWEFGPLRLRPFSDATALTRDAINKIAGEVFNDKFLKAVGHDNVADMLDRAANRFIRDTMFPGLQRAGQSRGRLQRLTAKGYYIFQSGDLTGEAGGGRKVPGLKGFADKKRLLAKTMYPIVRFMIDPRWLLMNRFEYNFLAMFRDGIRSPYHPHAKSNVGPDTVIPGYQTAGDPEVLSPAARRAANRGASDPMTPVGDTQIGMMHSREMAGFVGRIHNQRGNQMILDTIEEFINRQPETDSHLRDLMRLFPDDDTRPIYDKVNDFLYDMDMRGPHNTITDEAKRLFGAKVAEDMQPMLDVIVSRHKEIMNDITHMLQGNPGRSNLERVMNSYWLYWPLSYQLKAGKWLFQTLTEGFAGKKTNFGGATWVGYMVGEHKKRLATDPEYQQFMQDHEGLFLMASMFLPITPFDLGVSLNRGVRGIGGNLGWWGEYKRAQDPGSFASWMADLGPFYTIELLQQVWSETFPHRKTAAGGSVGGASLPTLPPSP